MIKTSKMTGEDRNFLEEEKLIEEYSELSGLSYEDIEKIIERDGIQIIEEAFDFLKEE